MVSLIGDAVGSGPLKRLLLLWCRESIRHGGIPPKAALTPEALGPHVLPHVFVYERRIEKDGRTRLFCRLAGGELRTIFKVEGTGRYLDELVPNEWLDDRTRYFSRCIDGGRPVLATGFLLARDAERCSYIRLLTPVRAVDETVHILGAVSFPPGSNAVYPDTALIPDSATEVAEMTDQEIKALAACLPA